MNRRNLSKLLFASAAGASLVVSRANAQSCTPPCYPQTGSEAAAGVTPVSMSYIPGQVLRYGTNTAPGVTDLSTAIQAAIDQQKHGGADVLLPPGVVAFGSTLVVYSGTRISGINPTESRLKYTGSAQAFVQSNPGTRIYDMSIQGFSLEDDGTGTIGFDLDSISTSVLENLLIDGFSTSIRIYSPTSGYSVYNRFYNVTAQNATNGFYLTGTSSNGNTFLSCRSNSCTTGVVIEDSNENHFNFCQFESGGTGVKITATVAGISPRNYVSQCRFENNITEDWNVGSNVTDTVFFMNHYVDNNLTYTDNGTRTQLVEIQGDASLWRMTSSVTSGAGTPYTFERDVAGGANVPAFVVRDSVTSWGTPTTLQVEIGRGSGHAIRVTDEDGLNETFGVRGDGRIRTNQASANTRTPSGATAQSLPIYDQSGALLGYIPIYGTQW